MVEKIQEKVTELLSYGCTRKDLIIAVPHILLMELYEESLHGGFIPPQPSAISLFGVEIYDQHPYNEILVYDKKNCYKGGNFLKKISLNILVKEAFHLHPS